MVEAEDWQLSSLTLGSQRRDQGLGGQALHCPVCLQRQGGRKELKSQERCPCQNRGPAGRPGFPGPGSEQGLYRHLELFVTYSTDAVVLKGLKFLVIGTLLN